MEIWKDIPGYEFYQVSDLGRVKSLRNRSLKILKLREKRTPYLQVVLYSNKKPKSFSVHQLVAMAFLGHEPNGNTLVVNHINYNKRDNKLVNIEVISNRGNTDKRHIKSTSKYVGVHWSETKKRWVTQIYINGSQKYLGSYLNEVDAHNAYTNFCNKNKINY